MRMRLVAVVWLAVVLQGCARTEEQKQAARREQAETAFVLGLLYVAGDGVPKDLTRARSYFKRACDQKYQKGCDNLAKHAGG